MSTSSQSPSLTTDLTGSTSTSTPSMLTESTTISNKQAPPLGSIIGGAVGGLAFFAIVILLGVWVYIRRHQRSAKDKDEGGVLEKGKGKVEARQAKGKEAAKRAGPEMKTEHGRG